MAFWNRKKNWEDEYDDYYAQDRGLEGSGDATKLRLFTHLFLLAFVGSIFLGIVGLVSGVTMVEKLVTSLANPVGVVWLVLLVTTYFCLLARRGWPAIAAFCCWLVLTIGGNQFTVRGLAYAVEGPYLGIDPLDMGEDAEPYEFVLVLGGGTTCEIGGRPQLSAAGDRVATAARMFHAKRVKTLICSGTQAFRSTPNDLHPREEARDILLGLGIPKESLLEIRGENTSQEMANLKTWLEQDDNQIDGRIGVLTSAWHLARVMRLAAKQGVELDPIPADFISSPFAPSPSMIVPTADNLRDTGLLCKEYLAGLVGR